MRAYHRLTEGERNQVYTLKKAGLTQCAIADQICVNKSTICWELKRIAGLRGYRPSRRIVWLVHGSHKFAGPLSQIRRGLELKR